MQLRLTLFTVSVFLQPPEYYTGRLIMYSRITEIYYRKTVGHILMKPVQIEGTTQKVFSQ